ncbi:MAG: TIR domain-containing protein [Aggregatilineales bacterium]
MNRVFVSYSRRNKNFAERIARDLSDAGLDVWVDWRQIHAGELWQNEIFRGIERSDILVACLSPDAVGSEWVQREINTARDQKKFIIPVMAINAYNNLQETDVLKWLLDVHFINFESRYEEAFPELLNALPGKRRVGVYDVFAPEKIPNPFKGLEAFQQTDAHFFFGRDRLIERGLKRLKQKDRMRSLAVVGASGSGKSSLVRAGIIPKLRAEAIAGSDRWHVTIFTPGGMPIDALAQRLSPLVPDMESSQIAEKLLNEPTSLHNIIEQIIERSGGGDDKRLVLVIDQFEEAFTRAGEKERQIFFDQLHHAASVKGGNTQIILTMRADFFDRLSQYPKLAEFFEQENMIIVTEMTAAELLHSIEGPAEAVGLKYEDGLAQRILDDVLSQPGSLPLLQYALKELYERRDGSLLANAAYDQIGGVRRALARHAEEIYSDLIAAQQSIMRRILLRLVEITEEGEATRRRVNRVDLSFRDMDDEAVQQLIDLMTAPSSRLLITSREIKASDDITTPPITWIEVSHEALIREWDRFKGWVSDNIESLRYGSELLKAATDWRQGNRDKAYLVTGNRLVRAESWLQDADATNLQRDFILASVEENDRREAEKDAQAERELELQRRSAARLRNFVIVLIVSLVVAIALSLYAINRQGVAVREGNRANVALTAAANALSTAERSGGEASSLALAANASRILADNNTDLALVLALAANEIDNSPPQSRRTLAEVAYAPGTRLVFSETGEAINDVALNSLNNLALSTSGSRILLWNSSTGSVLRTLNTDEAMHDEPISSVVFHPDGAIAASAGNDGRIVLWDVNPASPTFGTSLQQMQAHTGRVLDIQFDSSGTYLLSGSADDSAVLWTFDADTTMLTETTRFTRHEANVNAVAFNNNAARIVTADEDGVIQLWSRDGGIVCTFENDGPVNTVAFNPTKSSIATGSDDGIVRLWNTSATSGCDFDRQINEHGGASVNSLVYTSDGTELISAGDNSSIIFYNLEDDQVAGRFNGHTAGIRSLSLSSDNKRLLSASSDTSVRVWDTVSSERAQDFAGHEFNGLNGGDTIGIYSADDSQILSGSQDGIIRLWNVDSGLTIEVFQGHEGAINDVAFGADGTTLLSGSADGTVILWDATTGTSLTRMTGHETAVMTVSYLPDGTRAVSGAADGSIIEWDIDPASATFGQEIRRFGVGRAGHTKSVNAIVLHPDGEHFLSASSDETMILWTIADASIVRTYSDQKSTVMSVDFNNDGTRFVSAPVNGVVILWETETGDVISRFAGHVGSVNSVTFAPDDSLIITGGQDETLRVWDISTGLEVRRYNAGTPIVSLSITSDGRNVLTGLSDATLSTWRVLIEIRDLFDWVYLNRFVDVATCAERDLFRLTPCDAEGNQPLTTPFPIPTLTPTPANEVSLTIGGQAVVNIDTSLNVREGPGTDETPLITAEGQTIRLDDGVIVTLLDGPITRTGLVWWQIESEDGIIGWVVESVPEEGIRTLLPLP